MRKRSVCRGDTHIGLDAVVRGRISTIYKLKLSLGPATCRWWRHVDHVSHVAQGLNSYTPEPNCKVSEWHRRPTPEDNKTEAATVPLWMIRAWHPTGLVYDETAGLTPEMSMSTPRKSGPGTFPFRTHRIIFRPRLPIKRGVSRHRNSQEFA